jgi:hypothetical protein
MAITAAGAMYAAMAAAAASAAVSAYSAVQQGKAAEREADYNARVVQRNAVQEANTAEANAGIAQANKREALYAANLSASQLQRKAKFQNASVVTSLASQGLTLAGSGKDLALSMLSQSEEEQSLALYKGAVAGLSLERQTDAFRMQGANALGVGQNQAAGFKLAGANAKRAGYLGAASAVAQGISSMASYGAR